MLALQSKLGHVRSTSIFHEKVLRTGIFHFLNVWWNLPVMSSGFLAITSFFNSSNRHRSIQLTFLSLCEFWELVSFK